MKKNVGQSTIEFLIVSVFAIGILVVFIQLALNFTEGYLAHYATYMASRTFLVHERANVDVVSDYSTAVGVSEKIFENYGLPVEGLKFNYSGGDRPVDYFFTGAYYRYERPMSLFNYLGGGVTSQMYSESFLGKEPTRGECWARTKKAMAALNIPDELKRYTTVFDNGC